MRTCAVLWRWWIPVLVSVGSCVCNWSSDVCWCERFSFIYWLGPTPWLKGFLLCIVVCTSVDGFRHPDSVATLQDTATELYLSSKWRLSLKMGLVWPMCARILSCTDGSTRWLVPPHHKRLSSFVSVSAYAPRHSRILATSKVNCARFFVLWWE